MLVDLVKDVEEILDTLRIQEAHIVGLSLGGMVAQDAHFLLTDQV